MNASLSVYVCMCAAYACECGRTAAVEMWGKCCRRCLYLVLFKCSFHFFCSCLSAVYAISHIWHQRCFVVPSLAERGRASLSQLCLTRMSHCAAYANQWAYATCSVASLLTVTVCASLDRTVLKFCTCIVTCGETDF